MIYRLIEAALWGFSCGIAGSVYRSLAYEPFFSSWWRFGARYEKKWFFAPVWGCAPCISGQFALWTFLILRNLPALIKVIRVKGWFYPYSLQYFPEGLTGLFCLILAVAFAIGTAKIFYPKIEQ